MHVPKKAALLWSGGKDSALALHFARTNLRDLRLAKLITCVSQAFDRVSMHGVRRRLIEDQADAVGLPVEFVVIPHEDNAVCPMAHSTPGTSFPPNDSYTRTMLAALGRLRDDGVEVIVFGDIFLQDLRDFREKLLAHAGLTGAYPLWGRDSAALYRQFCELGFRAVTVCVDTNRLSVEHLGQLLTPAFGASLPAGVDPCGERGEYHSFAFDGPTFRRPVPFRLGGVHRQDPFAFQELFPADAPPEHGSAGGADRHHTATRSS
jgi:uncharacterized protein (TIGR00290 family)